MTLKNRFLARFKNYGEKFIQSVVHLNLKINNQKMNNILFLLN